MISGGGARYDRIVKRAWYASIGVAECWLVDPDNQTLERLVLDGDTYRIADGLAGDATFAPPSFPGLAIELGRLWTLPE